MIHRLFLLFSIFMLFQCTNTIGEETTRLTKIDENQHLAILKIDSLIQRLIATKTAAGVSWGVQLPNGTPQIYHHGYANIGDSIRIDDETILGLASVTKPITATAIGLLIEEGKLNLDDSLTSFFPDFPDGEQVTVYHLLSHTSGIPDWWAGELPEDTPEDWLMQAQPHTYLAQMKQVYFFPPGTQHLYSNTNYLLLAEIIEQISGQRYEAFVQERILAPLNMKKSFFGESVENRAIGYGKASDTTALEERENLAPMLRSVGGLQSTVADMLRFSAALFSDQMLSKKYVDQMTQQAQLSDGRPVYEAVYFPGEGIPPSPPDYMQKNSYGLGVALMEGFGEKVIWHTGGMPGFNAIWMYLPHNQCHFVFLANTENGLVTAFEDILKTAVEL